MSKSELVALGSEGTTMETMEVVSISTAKHVQKVERAPRHPEDEGSPVTFVGAVLGAFLGYASSAIPLGLPHSSDNWMAALAISVVGSGIGAFAIRKFDKRVMTLESIEKSLIEQGFDPAEIMKKTKFKGLSRRNEQRQILTHPKTGLEVSVINNSKGVWIERISYRPALDAWDDSVKALGLLYVLPERSKPTSPH